MTADELRERIVAAGGRGAWEYYRATATELCVAILVDYNDQTVTSRVCVAWDDLGSREKGGAADFELGQVARARERLARDLKLPKPDEAKP